ncbi:MAG: prepilin peptidase [Planctomycetaceae bacterium]|nr:prepilin peptidase [Planctomycetaceae bacterium]
MLEDPITPELPFTAWPLWASVLFWVWVACCGVTIGSFLNVVIYRAPRGQSLVHPGSRCPMCGHAIRARDNLPVLGWLILRGKCRDCGAAISARYPLVEALIGLVFLGVAGLELGLGGSNLPGASSDLASFWTERQLAGMASYHLFLITLLIAAAAMRIDGERMPRWLTGLAAVVGLVALLIWPWLHPLPSGIAWPSSQPADALVNGLLGGLAGWLAGCVRFAPVFSRVRAGGSLDGDPQLYGVAGIFLGWQAGLGVAVLVSLFGFAGACAARRWPRAARLPDELWLALAVLAVVAGWKWFAQLLAGLGLAAWFVALLGAAVIATLSPAEIRQRARFARSRESRESARVK